MRLALGVIWAHILIKFVRPAGYFSEQLLDVTKQVSYALQSFQDAAYMWIVLARWLWKHSVFEFLLPAFSTYVLIDLCLVTGHPYGSSRDNNLVVMIHDAFQATSYWNGFMPSPKYSGVIMDTHIYQVFSDAVRQFQVLLIRSELISFE